jgi:hypothetical protein
MGGTGHTSVGQHILQQEVRRKPTNPTLLTHMINTMAVTSPLLKRGGDGIWQTLIQGARGIVARFLKWSPASAISPIMIKFSQYTPHSTCYLLLVSVCRQD